MAIINIAFGGQNIGVEIPDLAMEATLQDVAAEAKAQTAFLSSISQKMGADSDEQVQATRQSARDLEQAIQEGNKDRKSMLGGLMGYMTNSLNSVNNTLTTMKGDEKLSSLTSGLFGAFGLGAIGAQLGTVFGIMEEFGQNMGNLRRVGTGYLENLQNLRTSAAEIGLGLEGLSALIAENGITVRSLGTNTTEGANALVDMTKRFRENTRAAGYFGMSSEEMTRLLIDEAEIRRRILDTDMQDERVRNKMVDSVERQLKLDEAVAKLTGQDIRDRIKAGQAFRSEAVNAALLSTMTVEQQEGINAVVKSLSSLGPSAQDGIQTAISNILAGLPAFTENDQFAQLAQTTQGMANIDLLGAVEQMAAAAKNGASALDLESMGAVLAQQFKDIPDEAIKAIALQARTGNQGAIALLNTRIESVSQGADNMGDATAAIANSLAELNTAIQNRTTELAGTQADMQAIGQGFRRQMMDSMLNAFGISDIADENGARQFTNLLNALEGLPSNERFKGFVDSMTHMVTLTSGAQGLVRILQGDFSSDNPSEFGYLTAAFAEALGADGFAKSMRKALTLSLGDDISKALSATFPDSSTIATFDAAVQKFYEIVMGSRINEIVNPDANNPNPNI